LKSRNFCSLGLNSSEMADAEEFRQSHALVAEGRGPERDLRTLAEFLRIVRVFSRVTIQVRPALGIHDL